MQMVPNHVKHHNRCYWDLPVCGETKTLLGYSDPPPNFFLTNTKATKNTIHFQSKAITTIKLK